MKYFFVSILLFFGMLFQCFSDDWYIKNGSFEELLNGLPHLPGELTLRCGECIDPISGLPYLYPDNPDNPFIYNTGLPANRSFCSGWYQPTKGTSDIFYRNSTYIESNVPDNNWFLQDICKQEPVGYCEGSTNQNGYAGIRFDCELNNGIESLQRREYLQQKLMHDLRQDSSYIVSFYVSLGPAQTSVHQRIFGNKKYAYTDEIGALFTVDPIVYDGIQYLVNPIYPYFEAKNRFFPQIYNSSSQILDQTGGVDGCNWMKIQGIITPWEDLSYITIGNFKKNLLHSGLKIDSLNVNSPYNLLMAYFIDSVSIEHIYIDNPGEQCDCQSIKNKVKLKLNNEESDTTKCCYTLIIDRKNKFRAADFDIKIKNKVSGFEYAEELNISQYEPIIEIDFCVNKSHFYTSDEVIVEYYFDGNVVCRDTLKVNCDCKCQLDSRNNDKDTTYRQNTLEFKQIGCDSAKCCYEISFMNITNCIQTIPIFSLHIPSFVNPFSYSITDNPSDNLIPLGFPPMYTLKWSYPSGPLILKPGEEVILGKICIDANVLGSFSIPIELNISKDTCNYYNLSQELRCFLPESIDSTDCCDNIKISKIPHSTDNGGCYYSIEVEFLNTPCCNFDSVEFDVSQKIFPNFDFGSPVYNATLPINSNTFSMGYFMNITGVQERIRLHFKDKYGNYPCTEIPFEVIFGNLFPGFDPCDTVIVYQGSNWGEYGVGHGKIRINDNSDIDNYGLSLYPNPADNELNIDFTMPVIEKYKIEITDIMGNKLFSIDGSKSKSLSNHYNVDTKKWVSGTYFVKVILENNIITKTFVISR